MKKTMVLVLLVLPMTIFAQLGGLLKAPKLNTREVDDFVTQVDNFEVQVDSATDLLHTATEFFFNSVDSFKTLPTMEKVWNTVKSDIKSAATDEMKSAAKQGYVKYAQNIASRKDKFGEYWESSDIRSELLSYLGNRQEMLSSVLDSLEKAVEIDTRAVERYDEIFTAGKTAVTDLTSQIAANPASVLTGKSVLDKGKNALESIQEIKKDIEEHIDLAKYIIERIKEILQ